MLGSHRASRVSTRSVLIGIGFSLAMIRPAVLLAITSDEFNAATLNTGVWAYVDPLGDAVQTMTGTQLSLAIPAGADHDIQDTGNGGNNAPRITQPAADADFQVEVKFDSIPTAAYQQEGIIVQETPTKFLRLEVFFFAPGDVRMYAAVIDGAARNDRGFVNNLTIGAAVYLRLTRTGGNWNLEYSPDGATYDVAESLNFNTAFNVTRIGVYGATSSADGVSAPAFTALVDYFRNTAMPIDADGDGVEDAQDNCPNDANAGQEDADGDGTGDVCDACPNDADNDADGDGVCGDVDNCPATANPGQEDADGDGIGDVCDTSVTDTDGDGVEDAQDNCPSEANAGQEDADGDGIGDACDACPNDADNDADGDGVCGDTDNCPAVANPGQEDTDTDGIGDACDSDVIDSDGDGASDAQDNCPNDANPDQEDADADGAGDACDGCPDDPAKTEPGACGCGEADTDTDGDGVADCIDNCPNDANPNQEDADGNGVGDVCDSGAGQPTPGGGCGSCAPMSGLTVFAGALGLWLMRSRRAAADWDRRERP